jgi:hypothetical protein
MFSLKQITNKISVFKQFQYFKRRAFTSDKKTLELERKFWYDFNIEERLINIGAKKISEKLINDEYIDNFNNYFLLLNDYILRNRLESTNNKWQLKYPSKMSDNLKNFENYYEIENHKQIIESIILISQKNNYFQVNEKKEIRDIDSLINLFDLKCIAKINSKRKTYLYDRIKIDLDETDFNYKLGEIELIMDDTSSTMFIEESSQIISILTQKLGMLYSLQKKIKFF